MIVINKITQVNKVKILTLLNYILGPDSLKDVIFCWICNVLWKMTLYVYYLRQVFYPPVVIT
jgi:hypothetical protein